MEKNSYYRTGLLPALFILVSLASSANALCDEVPSSEVPIEQLIKGTKTKSQVLHNGIRTRESDAFLRALRKMFALKKPKLHRKKISHLSCHLGDSEGGCEMLMLFSDAKIQNSQTGTPQISPRMAYSCKATDKDAPVNLLSIYTFRNENDENKIAVSMLVNKRVITEQVSSFKPASEKLEVGTRAGVLNIDFKSEYKEVIFSSGIPTYQGRVITMDEAREKMRAAKGEAPHTFEAEMIVQTQDGNKPVSFKCDEYMTPAKLAQQLLEKQNSSGQNRLSSRESIAVDQRKSGESMQVIGGASPKDAHGINGSYRSVAAK